MFAPKLAKGQANSAERPASKPATRRVDPSPVLQRGLSWDFSKIPTFPLNRPNDKRDGSPIAALAEAPAIVHEVVRSPGQPLDAATRAYFEPRFGRDFSQVRVHADARAGESARRVNAAGYAVNQDVVFGSGRYQPDSSTGRQLLAHELAHTVQQRNASAQGRSDPATAEAEAHGAAVLDMPAAGMAPQFGSFAPGLYRQPAGSASPAATAPAAMTEAEFRAIMKRKYFTRAIRTGTEVEQTDEVASRTHLVAPAITLPGWQSWNPGASSEVYESILKSLEDFESSVGGVPAIDTIVFFNTEYKLTANPAGVQTPHAEPNTGASFGAGRLTIYRAFTTLDKALPIARSNPQGKYPPVVIGVIGPGSTPGAPRPLPTREESRRRIITHELGHGLAEAADTVEPALFDEYKREVGWAATQPFQLFDIGQPAVQTAISNGTPPPAQFEITDQNWNSPKWVEQPVSDYMVSGGPSEDFAEAVLTFVRQPDLLRSRSPRRFRFLADRKARWQPALRQVPQMGDFPPPKGADRAG